MTARQRREFGPGNPIEDITASIDHAWQNAGTRVWGGVENVREQGGYILRDPVPQLQKLGDFSVDAARFAWEEALDVYGAGNMAWNQITRILQTPCEDKWKVIVWTALPAMGAALWLLMVPQPDQILENYLDPKAARKESRRRVRGAQKRRDTSKSGKKRRRGIGFPDVDSMIAAGLPGYEAMQGRDAGKGQVWTFDAINRVDRVLWWWLIADVTETFFTTWASGMQEARFCSAPVFWLADLAPLGTETGITPSASWWETWTAAGNSNPISLRNMVPQAFSAMSLQSGPAGNVTVIFSHAGARLRGGEGVSCEIIAYAIKNPGSASEELFVLDSQTVQALDTDEGRPFSIGGTVDIENVSSLRVVCTQRRIGPHFSINRLFQGNISVTVAGTEN